MKTLLTGATGFVGANVARALLTRGHEVRALVRPESNTMAIDGLDIETVRGDIVDRESVARAMQGRDAVVHCAALYSFWERDPSRFYKVNVEGTRTVMEEATRAGVQRIVYTSSTAVLGRPKTGLADETTEPEPGELSGHYRRSKYMAEKAVMEMARDGLPAIVVNPSAPVGPWDVKPTRTGQIVLDFLKGRMFGYMDTGLNLVDVEDVATGHVLALNKGTPGERYILGGENMTLKEMLAALARITGGRMPRVKLSRTLVLALAYLDSWIEGKVLRRPPFIPLEGVKEVKQPVWVDCSRAIKELDFPQNPVQNALAKAAKWFHDHHYVKTWVNGHD